MVNITLKKFCLSRDDFIACAVGIGKALIDVDQRENDNHEHPYYFSLLGDEASGKELVALAIDSVFQPERYPNGIEKNYSADEMLSGETEVQFRPIAFYNFRRLVEPSQKGFDRTLGRVIN